MTFVTHLSYRTSAGGAARCASQIHESMLKRGVDSALLAVVNESGGEQVFATEPSMNPLRRIYRHGLRTLYGRQDRIELKPDAACKVFTSDRSFRGIELMGELRDPDVIHMHWVAEMFDEAEFLPAATRKAPIVWTMHDMRPISGGCHYDLGCGRFRDGCGNCPQLVNSAPQDVSYRIWHRREKTFAQIAPNRLTFVALGEWMAREFQASPLCNRFPVHVIPNGVDTNLFRPAEVERQPLVPGLDPDAFVILFNSASLDNRIKGSALLQSALKQIEQKLSGESTDPPLPKLQLLIVGSGKVDYQTKIETVSLGYLTSDQQIAAAYQAADLFVIPSLQDNCPLTILESFGCGVPVVGFDTSGIPDLVKPGTTGLLAKSFEPADLAEKILTIVRDDQLRQTMSLQCRKMAVDNYSHEHQAQQYVDLYQQVLDAQTDPPAN